jgi:hypothetical protein
MMTASQAQLLMQIFGVFFLAIGLAARLSIWKGWFWRQQRMVYGYIPLGLLLIVYSFNEQAKAGLGPNYLVFQILTGLMLVIGAWWTARPPAFVKPDWVRWVEAHPKRVIDAMAQAVKKGESWGEKVKSKETVDAWARALKMKLPKKAV